MLQALLVLCGYTNEDNIMIKFYNTDLSKLEVMQNLIEKNYTSEITKHGDFYVLNAFPVYPFLIVPESDYDYVIGENEPGDSLKFGHIKSIVEEWEDGTTYKLDFVVPIHDKDGVDKLITVEKTYSGLEKNALIVKHSVLNYMIERRILDLSKLSTKLSDGLNKL